MGSVCRLARLVGELCIAGSLISMMVISKIQSHSPREYMIYFVMAAGYSVVLPLLLLACHVITVSAPAVLCAGLSFLFLLALILFKGKEFKEEMYKKFHV